MTEYQKILLIEDSDAEAGLIKHTISQAFDNNISITRCDTLTEAVDIISQQAFDVILLDLSLPDSHGTETFQTIQAHNEDAALVVLSGNDDEGLAESLIVAGAQDYICKNELDVEMCRRVFRYLAQRKTAEKRLKSAIADAQHANQTKSDFLANISHELRTPLNSMLILSKYLASSKGKRLNDEQLNYASTIHRSGKDLLHLINELLDMSKIESGKLEIDEEEFMMYPFIQDIKSQFLPLCLEKNILFTVNCEAGVSRIWNTDAHRLSQILKNLLSNAIKFTDSGRVSLTVAEDKDKNEENSELRFIVKDSGIGIPANKLSNVFESFQQATKQTSKKYGGTGLGLSISKKLAQLMGGDIEVSSVVGEGSEFTLSIQLKSAQSCSEEHSSNTEPEQSILTTQKCYEPIFEGRKILLVDDNKVNIFSIKTVLKNHGIDIMTASSGFEALSEFTKHPGLDIILMDIMMPGIDGYETIRRIRKLEEGEREPTKIVALTANAMPADRVECIESGADDYLTKPIDIDALISKMADLIGLQPNNVSTLKKHG